MPNAVHITLPGQNPPTPPKTTLKVLCYPAGDDLLKSTMIEMVDITDTVPKPPKARAAMC
jgi:hypothetical protein